MSRAKRVAIITILYQSEKHLDSYLQAVNKLNYPVESLEVFLLDNSNEAQAATKIEQAESNFPVHYLSSATNLGFAGGNNLVFEKLKDERPEGYFDYYFLLNQDTEIESECLAILVDEAELSLQAGLVEATQLPNSHPKYFDQKTNLTSWCSGGGVLIRRKALDEVGYFDDMFYMYCEDVDLSWRMWLAGWQCKLLPEARYYHETEELDVDKDQAFRHYYSFRNIQLINILYNSFFGGVKFYLISIASLFLKKHKYFLVRLKAFLVAHLLMPACLFRRCRRGFFVRHPQINFTRLSFGMKKIN